MLRRSGLHWTPGTGCFEGRTDEDVFEGGQEAWWVLSMMVSCESRTVELSKLSSHPKGAM